MTVLLEEGESRFHPDSPKTFHWIFNIILIFFKKKTYVNKAPPFLGIDFKNFVFDNCNGRFNIQKQSLDYDPDGDYVKVSGQKLYRQIYLNHFFNGCKIFVRINLAAFSFMQTVMDSGDPKRPQKAGPSAMEDDTTATERSGLYYWCRLS